MESLLEKFILLFFDLGLVTLYLLGACIVLVIIQLISYRIFKFNLLRYLNYILFEKYM